MDLTKRMEEGTVIVKLDGPIDGGEYCRRIHETIANGLEEGHRKFILDLADVSWINSMGVGFLVAASVAAVRQDAIVRLVGLTVRVDSVLRACGVVPHVWKAFPDEAAALASF